MSSLPASWHGIGVIDNKPVNEVTPLKRPRTIKLGPPTTNSTKKSTLSPLTPSEKPKKPVATIPRAGGPPERKTWTQRPKFDPSNLKKSSTNTPRTDTSPKTQTSAKTNGSAGLKDSNRQIRNIKPRMPSSVTNKPRAKSAGNNQELKTRTQEDTNMEILSLRKELAHTRDENTLLKGKLRRTEEELNKKIKNLEKQLATAKKDCSGIEKKKESTNETLATLKQKCQKLELELRTKDQTLRKLEVNASKNAAMANGTSKSPSSIPPTKPTSLRLSSSAPLNRPSPKSNQAINTELNKTKESMKKLEQENSNLKQKLKDKEQEIKTLKVHLSKAQKIPATIARASLGGTPPNTTKVSSVHAPTATVSSAKQTQRVSRSSIHRTNGVSKSTTTTTVITTTSNGHVVKKGKTVTVEHPTEKTDVLTIEEIVDDPKQTTPKYVDTVPIQSKEKAQELQRKSAARKIQRSWRSHRERVTKSDGSAPDNVNHINGQDNLIIYQAAEQVEIPENAEYIPEVLEPHLDQLMSKEHEAIDLLNFNQGNKTVEEQLSFTNQSKNNFHIHDEE